VNQPSLESFRVWLVASEDEAVETEFVDDVHFLGSAKGLGKSDPLFIVIKPRESIAWIGKPKCRANVVVNESGLAAFHEGPYRVISKLEFDWQSLALTAGGLSFMV